ncbi:MAG: pseudouridine synthase, partial [Patescibacteria group bacterium]
ITQRLTHPKFSHEKEYLVRYHGTLTPAIKTNLERGVEIASGRTAPCHIKIIKPGEALVVIHEGKKRQIRYMFSAGHCRVIFLQRIREGQIKLGNLLAGKWLKLDSFK